MCYTENIVSLEWLVQSKDQGEFLNATPFRIEPLVPAITRGITARANGGLFHAYAVYLPMGVAGKDGNPKKESLLPLLKATGARQIDAKGLAALTKKDNGLTKVIVITGDSMKVSNSLEEARKRNVREMKCSEFLGAVQNQEIRGPGSECD